MPEKTLLDQNKTRKLGKTIHPSAVNVIMSAQNECNTITNTVGLHWKWTIDNNIEV